MAPVQAQPTNTSHGGWADRRVERVLLGVACLVLALIVGMIFFVFEKALPSFRENGLGFFGDGNVREQIETIVSSSGSEQGFVYEIGAFKLLWGTFITTLGAVSIGLVVAVLASIFIVEFAPRRLRDVLTPVVRLLAAVPSVIYGLIGLLVIVPFVGNSLTSNETKASVQFVVQLNGRSLIVAVLILTVMITPIMIAIITDALTRVPTAWTEGAAALGVNRWRVMWTIAVRAVRPAIIAAAVLATARALGEAIMLAMVAGGVFAPNPLDGVTFFLEPTQPLGAAIVSNFEGIQSPPLEATIYAFGAILLVSAAFLSFAGYAAKQPLKQYGIRA